MVQVLPYVPGFGEQLGQVLAGAVQNVGQGLIDRRNNRIDQQILSQYANNPNLSPLQQLQMYMNLSPRSQQAIAPVFGEFIRQQSAGPQGIPQESQDQMGLKNSLEFLEENIPYTGATYLPGTKSFLGDSLNREAKEKRAEYDTTGFLLADKVFTHFNKGTISKDKLKKVEELAPKAKLSERENKARINTFRRLLNLPNDVSEKEFDKAYAKEKKILEKIESSEKPKLDSFYR